MTFSEKGLELLKELEGFRAQAYKDSAGIWTYGYGTIKKANGQPVKPGDSITEPKASDLMKLQVDAFAAKVDWLTRKIQLCQHQFDALVLLAYNIGEGGFKGSTVLKRVLVNPHDCTIRDAFMMWNKVTVNGIKTEIPGLTNRRKKEADLYFS